MATVKPRRRKGEGSLYRRADGIWLGTWEASQRDGRRHRRSVASRLFCVTLRKLSAHTHANIVPACRSCNNGKSDKEPDNWEPPATPDGLHREDILECITSYLCSMSMQQRSYRRIYAPISMLDDVLERIEV